MSGGCHVTAAITYYLTVTIKLADHVDEVHAEWARELPDLDTTPVGVVLRVARLSLSFDRRLQPTFSRFGLTPEGFDTLTALRRAGPPYRLSPTELWRSLMRSSAAMTKRLRRLEELGLIRRISDADDARVRLVELTDEGRELAERVLRVHIENERRVLSALTPGEIDTLAGLLRKLLVGFEAEDAPDDRPGRGRRRRPPQ
jgi:DNA-binding MarR family transcriptional regulator